MIDPWKEYGTFHQFFVYRSGSDCECWFISIEVVVLVQSSLGEFDDVADSCFGYSLTMFVFVMEFLPFRALLCSSASANYFSIPYRQTWIFSWLSSQWSMSDRLDYFTHMFHVENCNNGRFPSISIVHRILLYQQMLNTTNGKKPAISTPSFHLILRGDAPQWNGYLLGFANLARLSISPYSI